MASKKSTKKQYEVTVPVISQPCPFCNGIGEISIELAFSGGRFYDTFTVDCFCRRIASNIED